MSAAHGVEVALSGVTRRYGTQEILRGVDLTVRAGELLAILGQSGTGKSVLLRQIIGLERPDAGRIAVGGVELGEYLALPFDRRPFRTAMVFQNAALLASLNVHDNVALRLQERGGQTPGEVDRIVAEALEQVEMAGTEAKLPAELSGGMRKRVAIARALANAPELILYDEPTSDLDPILTEQVARLLQRIQATRGTTQVVVTHDLRLARAIADRIAVLGDGRIVECSTPDALLASTQPLTRQFLRAAALGT